MISLLCPTRGRPKAVLRMMDSVLSNAHNPIEFVFCVDEDDILTIDLMYKLKRQYGSDVKFHIGPRTGYISKMYNICASLAEGSILGQSDDDVVYHTKNWDLLIEDAFAQYPDRIVLVHGRDGLHDEKHGTHIFLHRWWYQEFGYYVREEFVGDYTETWWNDVANMLNRRIYLPELHTEHLHHTAGKADYDQTYADRDKLENSRNHGQLFDSLKDERIQAAERLRRLM